jgi:hypothetical protein
VTSDLAKPEGKGRPTPKRRQAEQSNRRPLIGNAASAKAADALAKATTKEERKAAKAAQRQALSAERTRHRQALVSGDEAGLTARDKGPIRRYARDYVDSRRWAGELVLPVALFVLAAGFFAPQFRVATTAVLYLMIVVVIFDCGRARGGLKRELAAKFGDKATKHDVRYGLMRSLQLRRFRLPKPRVARGERPS